MKLKLLSLALAICVCGIVLHAQALSEQNLIDLKKAGVDKAILVQQIEKDGISFPMDAGTTIRLKNLGFPDEVLSALINAGSKKSSSTADDPVKTLYSQGKYAELCDYLKSQLASNPTNYRLRTILIGALLRINQQPAALAELEKLRDQSQDARAKQYLDRASLLVSSWQKQEETKNKLLAALRSYNYPAADSAIDQLTASVMQKRILHMLIDSYAGKFDSVLKPGPPEAISFADQKQIEIIEEKINESQKQFKMLMDQADIYLHSPLIPSTCWAGFEGLPDFQHISLRDYADLVTNLTRIAPLNDDVMDMAFHLTFLTAKYEEVEALGDKILAAKGNIRIAFYARDRFFNVIIDAKKKTIYTQPVLHPFTVRYVYGWSGYKYDGDHNDFLGDVVGFDLAFDQIRGVAQKGRGPKAYALKFEPSGVAPDYSLMLFMYCSAGEEAELQATKNLGQFVLHVIGNPNIKAQLADPKKASHGSGFGDALMAMYGVTNGRTALGAAAMQMMTENKAKSEMAAQEQQATWQSMLARDYSSLLDGSVFDGLDKLVEAP